MMDTGIGSTILDNSRNQVCTCVSIYDECTVLYRSKESALPDFSKRDDEVGDVFLFFDVRGFLRPKCSFGFTNDC